MTSVYYCSYDQLAIEQLEMIMKELREAASDDKEEVRAAVAAAVVMV